MASRSRSQSSESERNPLRQVAGFLLVIAAVYVCVALLDYDAGDPSFNRATHGGTQNITGYVGARLADLWLQVLGLASALLVLTPLAWGVKLMFGRSVSHLWLRGSMLLVAMVLTATLIAPIEPGVSWPLAAGYGGSIGAVVHDAAPRLFGNMLFMVFLFAGSVFSTTMAFGMNADEWRAVGRFFRTGFLLVAALVMSVVDRIRNRSAEEEEEDDTGRYADEYEEEEEEEEETDEDEEDDEEDEEDDDDEDEDEEDLAWHQRAWEAVKSKLFFWRRDEEMDDDEEEEEEEEEEDDDEEEEEDEAPPEPRRKRAAPKKKASAQTALELPRGDYVMPAMTLLSTPPKQKKSGASEGALQQNARLLESVLNDFNVSGSIGKISPGPVVTLYELEPAAGTKSSRVVGLADDIARSMSAISARIAVISGKNAIGIELPNSVRETVFLRELLEHDSFQDNESKLPLALGKDIGGGPIVVDLARMPHLLVAGTTGSGKSVAINTMIMSLVYRLPPDECKFIMIDPKMLELSIYDGIPHLLTPVVTEPGKAVVALKWTVREMENRYRMMANLSVRNIDGYNKTIREARSKGRQLTRRVQTGFNPDTGHPVFEEAPLDMVELPYIVVVVDEMADLMLVAGKDIESSIQRLAQMARAAGIHIIMATQRPSVDVITGVIKANFPTRISFQVTSRIDSRTILGEQGAEQLLGQGDMLYMSGGGRITRVHGPFVSDREVEAVVAHLKAQGEPTYIDDVTREEEEDGIEGMEGGSGDDLYDKAVAIVSRDQKASTSYLQRQLKIGYNRAADLIDRMEREGVVSAANHAGKREVLARKSA